MLARGRILLLAACAIAPAHAHAWSDEGHRIVALIAQRLLAPATRQRVDGLLAADTDRLTATDFASRATWADRWRETNREHDHATGPWHVVGLALERPDLDSACYGFPTLPVGTPASEGPARDCVVGKIEQFTRELGDPDASEAEKILAFKYLLNLVGDLHQPLDAAAQSDDRGAAVKVLHDQRTVANTLGDYWNTTVVEKLGGEPEAIADALLTGAENETAEWSAGSPRSWALETAAVARDVAYRLPPTTVVDASGAAAYRLDVTYEIPAMAAARQQLARAGVRLAVLLNASLR